MIYFFVGGFDSLLRRSARGQKGERREFQDDRGTWCRMGGGEIDTSRCFPRKKQDPVLSCGTLAALSYTQSSTLLPSLSLSLSLSLSQSLLFLPFFLPFHPQLLASMDEIIIHYPHMDEIILGYLHMDEIIVNYPHMDEIPLPPYGWDNPRLPSYGWDSITPIWMR